MGNAESSTPFSQVDALKYQLSALEQKLSSLEQTHQQRNVWPSQGAAGSELFICGAHLRCRRETSVLTGPVIGKVTGSTAHILLEVNNTARVTCYVCLADDNCPQGRVVCQETLLMPARRPKVFVMTHLSPGEKYLVCFGGVKRSDAQERVGQFVTHNLHDSLSRVLAVSLDKPEQVLRGEKNTWEVLAERTTNEVSSR